MGTMHIEREVVTCEVVIVAPRASTVRRTKKSNVRDQRENFGKLL